MMNRRELMKYFAAGSIIAPAAAAGVTARLVEPAKIEIVKPEPMIIQEYQCAEIRSVTISLDMRDGSTHTFKGARGPFRWGEGKFRTGENVQVQIVFADESKEALSPAFFETIGDIGAVGTIR